MRPKFDKDRYSKFDGPAKEAGIDFFKSLYPEAIVVNPTENYKDDLIVYINKNKIGVQVEIKTGWKSTGFPFGTMHIPASKVTNALRNYDEVWFLVFNVNCSSVGLIRVNTATTLKTIEKVNVYSKHKPEPFCEFKLDQIQFFEAT